MPGIPPPARAVAASGRALLHTVGAGLVRVLYPPRCLGCGAGVDETEEPLCARCAARLDRPAPEGLAARLGTLPQGTSVFALWRFDPDGTVQRLQHALKYGNRPVYGRRLGRHLGAAVRAEAPAADRAEAVVVPVPLHAARQLERGYNQSACLAEGVAEALGLSVVPAVARTRATRTQTRLDRSARHRNVADAFTLTRPLAARHVLLVDDVLTTGATLLAAARPLRDAGARVSLLALAAAGV